MISKYTSGLTQQKKRRKKKKIKVHATDTGLKIILIKIECKQMGFIYEMK